MIFSRALFRSVTGIPPVAVFIAAVLGPAPSSEAGLTLVSADSSFFSSYFTIGVSSTNAPVAPVYSTYNTFPYTYLSSTGGGLPYLSTAPNTPFQNTSTSTVPSPNYFYNTSTTNPINGPGTSVPSNFGSATSEIYALSSGLAVGTTAQGGLLWSQKNALANGLSPGSGMASVSISTATATFTNTTAGTVDLVTPASLLNVNGTVDTSLGGFVAAGLSSSYKLSGGSFGAGFTTSLDSITLGGTSTTGFNATTGSLDYDYSNAPVTNGGSLTGFGEVVGKTSYNLTFGESITINATLTLLSGPGSSIQITSGLPVYYSLLSFQIPPEAVGVFANAPSAVVPEPSTVLLLGGGLAMAGLWSRSPRRRTGAGA